MKTKTYNRKNLTDYLLGALPEAESELFDELSFVDDEFSDQLKVVEKDLLDAYARGELTGRTLENFESFYLASPLRREKAEFAKAFQTFAEKELAAAETGPAALHETETVSKGFWANLLTVPRLSMQWGFALAALAFLLLGGWFRLENSRLRTELNKTPRGDETIPNESPAPNNENQLRDALAELELRNAETEKELAEIRRRRDALEKELKKQPPASRPEKQAPADRPPERRLNIASFILTPARRGAGRLPTVSIPPRTDLAAMRLELETDDFSFYRAVLTDQTGKNLWQSGNLKAKGARENKGLNLRFPAKLLKSQIYTLTVSGISGDGTTAVIGSYPFRTVLQIRE